MSCPHTQYLKSVLSAGNVIHEISPRGDAHVCTMWNPGKVINTDKVAMMANGPAVKIASSDPLCLIGPIDKIALLIGACRHPKR
ncbi:MAG: hypothetical protein HY092_02775 [Candidatus Kerfeldbacteria bacterium]|nr:hypothetical protein [Candidatus Kerfeldbacteria bacterium]